MAKNITRVYLLNVPLEDDMKNTLYFANASAQQSYFNSQIGKTYLNVSYQSNTRTFRCPEMYDNVRQYNYIMWQNTAYSNKWYYAFIKKLTYVNEGYTDVEYEIDALQTYMFDITIKPSFVEREHTNNDTVGNNTLPENLELGEYVKNSNGGMEQIGSTTIWYAMGVSDLVGTVSRPVGGIINSLPNGLYYILTDNIGNLQGISKRYDELGKQTAIYTMFSFPKEILTVGSYDYYQSASWRIETNGQTWTYNIYVPTVSIGVSKLVDSYNIGVPSGIAKTYVPRNNKLKTFPYRYFNITNNNGTTVTYHYEDFNGAPNFRQEGVFCVGCSTKLFPTNYKGMNSDDLTYEYGITGGKYPTISWNSDSYTNWLTQNAVNVGLGVANTVVNAGVGLATGNVVGAGMSFLGGVSSAVSEMYKASLMPDQARGDTNVGDINFSKNKVRYTVYHLSIKETYARIIDDYFDLFGYKTNRLKVPNVAHRQNWWYTKTVNANITGNVPNDEMNKIKQAYDNGLTFWRNPANFLNYSVSNGIV